MFTIKQVKKIITWTGGCEIDNYYEYLNAISYQLKWQNPTQQDPASRNAVPDEEREEVSRVEREREEAHPRRPQRVAARPPLGPHHMSSWRSEMLPINIFNIFWMPRSFDSLMYI